MPIVRRSHARWGAREADDLDLLRPVELHRPPIHLNGRGRQAGDGADHILVVERAVSQQGVRKPLDLADVAAHQHARRLAQSGLLALAINIPTGADALDERNPQRRRGRSS